jgi:hypothetical protein
VTGVTHDTTSIESISVLSTDSSISRADFVVGRIETHMTQYSEQSDGEVVTSWARPELTIVGVLAAVAIVAAFFR